MLEKGRTEKQVCAGWAIFVCVLVFSEFLGVRLQAAEEVRAAEITCLYVAVTFGISALAGVIMYRLLPIILQKFSERREKHLPVTRTVGMRVFISIWGILFLCYLPCFFAFYPGLYNNDMSWQWQMYITGHFSTHHPLLHTWMAGWLFELGKLLFGSYNAGLALYCIIQLLILSACIAIALRYLLQIGCSKIIFGVVALFYGIYPYIPVMGLSTTKDAVFGPLFLVIFVCLCDMVKRQEIYRGWKLAGFLGLLAVAGMFRNNAVYSFGLTGIFLLILLLFPKFRRACGLFLGKIAMLLFVGVLFAQCGLVSMKTACGAESGKKNEMFSIPCQQLARTYLSHEKEMTEEEKQEIFHYIPEEAMLQYTYYISDPVKNNLDEAALKKDFSGFLKVWVKNGIKYPSSYMKAFLNQNFGIWYLLGNTGSNIPYSYRDPVDEEHIFTEDSRIPWLKNIYMWFHYENYEKYLPFMSMVFYMPFFCWMTVWGSVSVWAVKKRCVWILPVFLLSYIFTVLLGPCIPVRYLFNILLCAPFFCAVLRFMPETAQGDGNGKTENKTEKNA